MSVNRLRHKGTGPKRHTIPALFTFPFEVPEDVLDDLGGIIREHLYTDDIGKSHYPVADPKYVELANHIPEGYRDIALHFHREGSEGLDEKSYTEWNERSNPNGPLRTFMAYFFPKAYRVRIGHMPAHKELNWHIDTNSTVAVRVQIPITHDYNKSQIQFDIRTKDGIEIANNPIGECFMTNTAWPHRVTNHTDEGRFTMMFTIEYNDLIQAGAPEPIKP